MSQEADDTEDDSDGAAAANLDAAAMRRKMEIDRDIDSALGTPKIYRKRFQAPDYESLALSGEVGLGRTTSWTTNPTSSPRMSTQHVNQRAKKSAQRAVDLLLEDVMEQF